MKYAGTITVLDEDGNSVYERELTPDEVVEELIAKVKADGKYTVGPRTTPGKAAEQREEADGRSRTHGRSCCGSKGSRHMKGCKFAGKPGKGKKDSFDEDDAEHRAKQKEIIEAKFRGAVKGMHKHGYTPDEIARNLQRGQKDVEEALAWLEHEGKL